MQNANVYGKEVPQTGTSYAILECVGRALGQCAAASEAAAAALPPNKIGRREATEKTDLVCDRAPSGAYAVQKREGFFNTPGKQEDGEASLAQEGADEDSAPPPMLPPPVTGVDAAPPASPTPPDSPATPSAVKLRAERRRELRAERKAAAAAGTPLKAQPSPGSVAGRWPSAAAEDAAAPAQVKVRVHCATLFARVAAAFGGGRYSQGEVARRLAGTADGGAVRRSELPSPGKGGSKFFFADDLVMKSVSEGEAATLKLLLPLYTAHVVANPGTLLPRFFAWVTVSYRSHLGGKASIRLLVMENVVCSPHVVSTLYDLKGSTVNRDGHSVLPIAGGGGGGGGTPGAESTGTPPAEHGVQKGGVASRLFTTRSSVSSSGGGSEDGGGLLASSPPSPGGAPRATVYKDKGLHGRVMSPADPQGILRRLEADVLFLRKQNIVDYSLLAGVRQRQQEEDQEKGGGLEAGDTGLSSTTRGEVYYLGVIDVLQPYTTAKKLETCFKGVVAREEDISIVAPPEYSLRFLGAACALLGCDISDSDAE